MGRAVSVAALLFTWLLLGGCVVSPQAGLEEASRARAQGQVDLALARYHQLINQGGLQGGDLALVLTARAHLYHEIKRDQDALEDLDRALRVAPPDFALGYLTRGLVCASLGLGTESRRERHSYLIKAETDLKYFLLLYPGRPPTPPESVPQTRQLLALIGEELAQLRAADAAEPEAWPAGPGLAPRAWPAPSREAEPPRVRTGPPAASTPSVTQDAPEPRQEGRPAIIFRPAKPAPPPVPPTTLGPAGPESPKPAPPAPHPLTKPPAPEPPGHLPTPAHLPTPPPVMARPTPPPSPPTAPSPGKPPAKKEEKKKEDDKKK